MATLKADVQGKRKDGTHLVYILVTHNRRNLYMKPPLGRNGKWRSKRLKGNLRHLCLSADLKKLIEHNYQLLNQTDTQSWTLQEVIEYLKNSSEDISFTDYIRKFIQKMQNDSRMRTAKKTTNVH